MFHIISIIAFIITFAGIAFHCIAFPSGTGQRWRPLDILRKIVHLLTLLFLEQRLSLLGILKKLVYLLALLCFVVLVVTGFGPSLVLGRPLSGYLMMAHATFAPVFAGCLAFLALMWAHHCRFNESDWPWLLCLIRRQAADRELLAERFALGRKIAFWLIVLLALPLILSVVLSMFPLFGTGAQQFLLHLHRYSALLLALVAIVHTYLVIRTQMQE